MDQEQYLRRAAKCLLMAVESTEPDKQIAMLNMAQSWLQQSEKVQNSSQQGDSEAA
jgi:hypothetical protein